MRRAPAVPHGRAAIAFLQHMVLLYLIRGKLQENQANFPQFFSALSAEKRAFCRFPAYNGEKASAHFGDLGCALTDAQANALQGVDVALIPVGGFYTIDAAQAKATADRIGAKVVVPMHYRTARFGLEPIATLDEFLRLCADPVLLDRDTFTVGEVRRGVVVPAGPV